MKTRSICLPLLLALFYSAISYAQWVQGNSGLNNTALHLYQGIVVSPNIGCANVYSGPSVTDSIKACVPSGTTGSIMFGPSGSFWAVDFSNGISGWCARGDLVHPVPGILSFTVSGTNLFAGTTDGVFRSTNNGTAWMPVDHGLLVPYTDYWYIHALAAFDTNLFVATTYGVYLSTDNGDNWNWDNTGLPYGFSIQTLAVSGTNLFASTGKSVFLSTNSGANWSNVDTSGTSLNAISLAVMGTNLFAGTGNGVFLSTNGANWASASAGLSPFTEVDGLIVSGTNIFAGTFNHGIYLSTNNGTSWTPRDSGMTNEWVKSFAVSSNNIFAGTMGGGICVSSNSGLTWTAVNAGLPSPYPNIYALMVSATDLFAGTPGGILRRPLSEMVTSINQLPAIAHSFKLEQNYPNPFNLSTRIAFSITKQGPVSLRVYDVLGRVVATLVNENRKAGQYTEQFEGGRVASGVYVYILQTSEGRLTHRMMMLK